MTGLTPSWTKSSRSNGSSSCVEARALAGWVEFRDSKDLDGLHLRVPVDAHQAFVTALKAGGFDQT